MKTFQLTITELEFIINRARQMKIKDDSLSETIYFVIESSSKYHLGNDEGIAYLKSGYAECNSKLITHFNDI